MAKKLETLSTFEKLENSLTNGIAKILSYDTNKHDANGNNSFKQTHANGNNSYTKPFTIKITAQKRSFLLRNSSVNVNKSAVSCGFSHIY